MVSPYKKKNIYTSIFSLSIFGLMIAALATTWYVWDNTFSFRSTDQTLNSGSGMTGVMTSTTLNRTTILYDLIGFRTNVLKSGSTAKAQTYKSHGYADMPSVTAIFRVCTAFVLIALIFSLSISVIQLVFLNSYIRNKILYLVGMTIFRLGLIAVSVLTIFSTVIAFLALLGISAAFKEDQPFCTEGPCRGFASTVTSTFDDDAVKSVTKWGPDAGWYITLCSVPLSLVLLYFVVFNRFPLPVISEASSGEAL
jgi:hypothetical protein